MTNDKPTLDSIVAKVEAILRLRCAVRNAHETITSTSRELAKYRLELSELEASLAKPVGDPGRRPKIPAPPWLGTKRVPYPKAKKGNIVWVGRRKVLGVLQDSKGRVKFNGKIYKCDPKDLYYPYPGEFASLEDK